MTVSYANEVATASTLTFYRLFLRWRGSVWKLAHGELVVWTVLTVLHTAFLFFLAKMGVGEEYFRFLRYLSANTELSYELLPFIIGFTASYCFDRWFDIFNCLHWPDNTAHLLNTFIRASKRRLRKTLARHILLAYIIILRDISPRIRRRFPKMQHFVDAKLMTETELKMLYDVRLPVKACKYWIPIQWIVVRIREMRAANKTDSLMSDYETMELFKEIGRMRGKLGELLSYDWVPMPLAFLQIITAAVYFHVLRSVVSLYPHVASDDQKWLPAMLGMAFVITLCQLILYVGYLKSIQVILNPFGDDDDDFECDQLIEHYRATVSDLLYMREIRLPSTPSRDEPSPARRLPHTIASVCLSKARPSLQLVGSLANYKKKRLVSAPI